MKKIVALLFACLMAVSLLSACGGGSGAANEKKSYTEEDYAYYVAEEAVKDLKSRLKRPSSIELNIVMVVKKSLSSEYEIAVDYSAQNELGGFNRDVEYYALVLETSDGEPNGVRESNFASLLDKRHFEDSVLDDDNTVYEIDITKLNY